MLIPKKKTLMDAHVGTFSGVDNLYNLGKTGVSISREFYQASYEIEDILGK